MIGERSVILDKLLVCPICQSELLLGEMHEKGVVSCSRCKRAYTCRDGLFDFTPVPPPDADVVEKWHLWQQLQDNGLASYTETPELSLSVGHREDAKAFSSFCQLSGLVLDVGCGPQDVPSYAVQDFPGQFVGIDPLRGVQPRRFTFVQGIGEYLPFRGATFDRVLFATSLDHMLVPTRALAEARRVVKLDGTVNIWFGETGEAVQSQPEETVRMRYLRMAQKGISLLRQGHLLAILRSLAFLTGLRKTPRARLKARHKACLARLKVPDGAVDHFHTSHMNWPALEEWLNESGLLVEEIAKLSGTSSRFVRARRAES